jgi:CRISPR-associated protein Csd1
MNWLEALYNTYEDNVQYIGKVPNAGADATRNEPLAPGFHVIQNTHITVTLKPDGTFVAAQVNSDDDLVSIIPATEDSASRAVDISPHPLCDKLQYVSKDSSYFPDAQRARCEEAYTKYKDLLRSWTEISTCSELLRPVLTYIENNDLISDLVREKILVLDDEGKILTSWKGDKSDKPSIFSVKGLPKPDAAFVRWDIIAENGAITHLCRSEKLRADWQDFQNKQISKKGLCYINGKDMPLMKKHLKFIRYSGDMAKLISSNDKDGYTFRGRFTSPEEACGVSMEVSWKAHNVLRWLIAKQGRHFDDLFILAWSPKHLSVPSPCDSSSKWLDEEDEDDDIPQNNQYQQQIRAFRVALSGNTSHLSPQYKEAPICVLSLNSASPGRMSLSSYQEFAFSDYLNNLLHWHASASWVFTTKDKVSDKYKPIVASPSIYTIISAAYGVDSDQKIRSYVARRLLPCVLRQEPIPRDIENLCIIRASSPNSFENATDWRRTLSVACSIYRYNHLTNNSNSSNDMSLNTTITDRSYLFGRLLAVAEALENAALNVSNAKRPTTAEKLMQRFQQRPCDTWQVIEKNLQPYRQILKRNKPGLLNFFDSVLDQIMSLFQTEEDYASNAPLTGYYLLAYHCQRSDIYTSKNNGPEETPEE